MKFNKDIDCNHCTFKCDIYFAVKNSKFSFEDINPLHVYYNRHENICKQGSEVTHAIFVLAGTAKLYIEGLNGRNIILNMLTPGNYIGLLSFFETPVYSYSVAAIENSQICMVDINFIKQLYISNHDFLLNLNKAFGKSVSSILEKIITLNQKNIRGRIADSLLYLSDLYNDDKYKMILTRKELGELSAISEENAVRLLTEFKKEGLIEVEGKIISILDKKLMKKISEVG